MSWRSVAKNPVRLIPRSSQILRCLSFRRPDQTPALSGALGPGYLPGKALVGRVGRPVMPSCWRAWLHLASLVEERGDLPGYPLEFLALAVVGDEVLK